MAQPVEVAQRAENGLTSDQLLARLQADATLRAEVAAADVIVLGVGGADLNDGDDALAAGGCAGTACYDDALTTFGENVDAITRVLVELRSGEPTVLRAVTPANALTGAEDVIPPYLVPIATDIGVHQAAALRESICSSMQAHGGACIDVLTAFNGPDGTGDGYRAGLLRKCCYPSDDGQQLTA